MNREIYLKSISESLALLKHEVELSNTINLYDINISSEDFYCGLLNLIYGYELKNANHLEKNAPAIDLIDRKNRIAVQVTSDNRSTKIKHTIEEFNKNKEYQFYDRLIILILTRKKKYSSEFDTDGKFTFDKKRDILDIESLIKKIKEIETNQIKKIKQYLSEELYREDEAEKDTRPNEVITIIDLIVHISQNKKVKKMQETIVDPNYKIYKRFQKFAHNLITEYKMLYPIYGETLRIANEILEIDEAKEIIIMLYLQDISLKILEEENDDPIAALNQLVKHFEKELSENGKNYDYCAIKFYLMDEMIKCNVFPNKRSEYDASK